MVIYEGKAVFEGVAIGKLSVYKKNEETVKREKVTDVEAEMLIQCHVSAPVLHHDEVPSGRIVRYSSYLTSCGSDHLCTHGCSDIDALMI